MKLGAAVALLVLPVRAGPVALNARTPEFFHPPAAKEGYCLLLRTFQMSVAEFAGDFHQRAPSHFREANTLSARTPSLR
jgi:hypothetical protein